MRHFISLLITIFLFFAQGHAQSTNSNYGTGSGAGYGASNSFLGYYTGNHVRTSSNSFIGSYAGYTLFTSGNSNDFLGANSGYSTTSGSYNTFVGYATGYYNTSGSNNVFVGSQSGYNNISGSQNTYFGNQTGFNNQYGSGNVFIGNAAGYYETGSNKLYIDYTATSTPLIYGDFNLRRVGISVIPSYQFQVQNAYTDGYTWYNASDKNLKTNFRSIENEGILNKLKQLKIERWNYKDDSLKTSHIGPYAQDFNILFGLGKNIKSISTVDEIGIALASVQQLAHKIDTMNSNEPLAGDSLISSHLDGLGSSNSEKRNFEVKLVIPSNTVYAKFTLYDSKGDVVGSKQINEKGSVNISINKSLLKKGSYLYHLSTDSGEQFDKIQIQNTDE